MGDSINVDFSPLEKTPDFVGGYQNAFKAGRALAAEQISGNAMQSYLANPTAPIDPQLGAANPEAAIQLQGLQQKATDKAANVTAATAMASGDNAGAMKALAPTGNLDAIAKVHEWAQQAHEEQVKLASEKTGHLAQISMAIANAPADPSQPNGPKASPEQRLSMAQHAAALHPEYGIKPTDLTIDKFTDDGIQSSINETLGVKGALEQALALRKQTHTEQHDNATLAETANYHKIEAGQKQQEIGIQGAHLALDRTKFNTEQSQRVSLAPDTVSFLADRLLTGDKSALQNVGRGTQGANDLRAIQNMVVQKAASQGITGAKLAGIMQNFAGDTAAARTAGSLDAKMSIRSGEVDKFAGLAQDASDQVPRSQWQTFNRLVQMGQTETSDPKLKALLVQTQGLINARAAAIGQGQVHIGDQVEGRKLLSTADGPEAFKSAIKAFQSESHAVRDAVSDYRHPGANPTTPPPGKRPALSDIFK